MEDQDARTREIKAGIISRLRMQLTKKDEEIARLKAKLQHAGKRKG